MENAQIERMLASLWAALCKANLSRSASSRPKAWMMPMPVTCSWTKTLILATSFRTLTKAFLMAFWNTRVAISNTGIGNSTTTRQLHVHPQHRGDHHRQFQEVSRQHSSSPLEKTCRDAIHITNVALVTS